MIEISKTDVARLIKLLDDAACYYNRNGKSNKEFNQARMISLLNKKLKLKLYHEKDKERESC